MQRLRSLILCNILSLGCVHHPYQVLARKDALYEVKADANRFLVECEDLENGRTGMMIHVLDDADTYFSAILTLMTTPQECAVRKRAVEGILRGGREIIFSGIGDLESPRIKDRWTWMFPGLGTFRDNGRTMTWMFIRNERGQCYGAYSIGEKPCPRDEFPLTR